LCIRTRLLTIRRLPSSRRYSNFQASTNKSVDNLFFFWFYIYARIYNWS